MVADTFPVTPVRSMSGSRAQTKTAPDKKTLLSTSRPVSAAAGSSTGLKRILRVSTTEAVT